MEQARVEEGSERFYDVLRDDEGGVYVTTEYAALPRKGIDENYRPVKLPGFEPFTDTSHTMSQTDLLAVPGGEQAVQDWDRRDHSRLIRFDDAEFQKSCDGDREMMTGVRGGDSA